MTNERFRRAANAHETGVWLLFWCPGCMEAHGPCIKRPPDDPERPVWDFDGNWTAPTLSPSLLVWIDGKRGEGRRCHSFIRGGRIEFLGDCYHALKGQTVEIPPWPDVESAAMTKRRQHDPEPSKKPAATRPAPKPFVNQLPPAIARPAFPPTRSGQTPVLPRLAPAAAQTNADPSAPLRTDGPTIERYVAAGYGPGMYPPAGYAEVPSPGLTRYRAGGLVFETEAAQTAARDAHDKGTDIAGPPVLLPKDTPKQKCEACNGTGVINHGEGKSRCTVCAGAGEVARR